MNSAADERRLLFGATMLFPLPNVHEPEAKTPFR